MIKRLLQGYLNHKNQLKQLEMVGGVKAISFYKDNKNKVDLDDLIDFYKNGMTIRR